jgi:hypothetical protein
MKFHCFFVVNCSKKKFLTKQKGTFFEKLLKTKKGLHTKQKKGIVHNFCTKKAVK